MILFFFDTLKICILNDVPVAGHTVNSSFLQHLMLRCSVSAAQV